MNPNQPCEQSGPSRGMLIVLAGVFVVAVGGALWASKLLTTASGDADLDVRRARIAGMTDAEKEQLRIKQERFAKLDASEREKLRELYAAIKNHPRSAELEHVMMRYRQWLRELTPEDRAALLTTDVSQRLAVVESLQEKLHQRYLAEAGKEMSKEDAEAVRKWMDEFATSRVAKALEAADGREKRWLQKAIDEDDESLQRHIVWQFIGRGKIPPPDEEDHRRLDAAMSKELREKFARARTNEERSRVVNSWIMGAMSFRRGWGGPSDEDLKKELEKLPEEERQRISTLSPEMMREALKRKWWESRFNRGRPGRGERGPGDRPPGPPPGSPPGRGNRGNDDRDGDDRDGDRRGGRRRDNDDRDGNRDDRRRGDRDRGDNDRDDERGRDDERDGRRDDSQAHENGDAKPLEKPEDKSADQSGDQSGERPADGDAAAVRRALIRTYGAT